MRRGQWGRPFWGPPVALTKFKALFPDGICSVCGHGPGNHELKANRVLCTLHEGGSPGEVFGAGEFLGSIMAWVRNQARGWPIVRQCKTGDPGCRHAECPPCGGSAMAEPGKELPTHVCRRPA